MSSRWRGQFTPHADEVETYNQAPPRHRHPGTAIPEVIGSVSRDTVIRRLEETDLHPDLIRPLEEQVYQKTLQEIEQLRCGRQAEIYQSLYLANCRHLIANLKADNNIGNRQLIERVNQGQLALAQLVRLAPHAMHPERWHTLVEKRQYDLDQSTKKPEATTDLFWCGRCHKNQCTYYESQDRSADEPMTLHITCCKCGLKWKR